MVRHSEKGTEIRNEKSASIGDPVDLLSHDVFLNKIVCRLYLLFGL